MNMRILIDKINENKAVIGIIGLGYVGLPLALRFVEENFSVIGFDIDEDKINNLNNGKSYIEHISSSLISNAIEKSFIATSNYAKIMDTDILIICVPTPLSKQREPDLTYILNTIETILPYLHKNQLLSLESTTYPGTTEEILKPKIESIGLIIGTDISLVFSPEREDPGNILYSTKSIPKIIGGITKTCLEVGMTLYEKVISSVVPVSSTRTAEMTKLLENIHRAVNIGLVNEMKIVADKMGIDIHEVINAAATKPFGFTPFYPGPGLGGHCIPIDPFYLTWKAREYGIHTRFIELAGEVNNSMPEWVISKLSDALNEREKSLKGSKILVLGISYKKNIDDMRESPSVRMMELLRNKGAILSYSDPHVPIFPKMREHIFDLKSIHLNSDSIKSFDCILLATDHDAFNYELIKNNSNLIIDTRGKYKEKTDKIVKA
ncbi:nucleotide sugar dehydrogenase [Fluviispira sanaruensis]|uniref:Nucleotide sugar dehydrogenase n=1 Tax=Fluviispira sanaruensis TaxID=2493639 RepID=A0A4P2VL40_FLUSA|nr:nucleotide sugar dehydrogenase [Fluviispira sanaruensis]BBH54053.1 nucleotide sugar dehydrogenase [Fluviispira sanaruensis]